MTYDLITTMRILLLTPGTGSFYCGTCLRDNALAMALRRLGHDAFMVPMYLPPTLDEESAAENSPIVFGGVNVYLQQVSGLFRKTPRWIDRMFDSPWVLQAAAKRAGMTKASELGEMTLSMLRGEDGNQAKELDNLAEWLASDGKADVIILSNALLIGLARRIKQKTGALVVCTLQGEDTFLDSLNPPYDKRSWDTLIERSPDIDVFIAVSHYHASIMTRRMCLPQEKVHVVYNGIALEGYRAEGSGVEGRGSGQDTIDTTKSSSNDNLSRIPEPGPRIPARRPPTPDPHPTIGYLARMYAPKGLETLVNAYIQLRKKGTVPQAKLKIAGAQTEGDLSYVASLTEKLTAAGLAQDVYFFPNIDHKEKVAFLKSLSVFSVPATYGESFGLYVIEALAAGVPVVQPRHAVFPELLAETGGGILCEPDDPTALADAIEGLLLDPEKARALGMSGQQTVFEKFSADAMARNVARIVA